jgi:cell division protein FtsL
VTPACRQAGNRRRHKNQKLAIQKMEQQKHNKRSGTVIKKLVNYRWIVQKLPFILFLAFLAVLYIANGHWADNTIRDINKTAKEVKDLQYEYKSLKSEEMFKSRESQITEAASPLGLKIPGRQTHAVEKREERALNPVNENHK